MSTTLAPSALVALPAASHNLADLQAAFNARRAELLQRVHSATTAGRILEMFRHAQIVGVQLQPMPAPRAQPRDGRGRFLSQAWLAAAESYSNADLAWFRSPIR